MDWKGRNKTSPFTNEMVYYIEKPKVSTNKLLELLSSASLQNCRLICKNQLYFYTLVMNNQKTKLVK